MARNMLALGAYSCGLVSIVCLLITIGMLVVMFPETSGTFFTFILFGGVLLGALAAILAKFAERRGAAPLITVGWWMGVVGLGTPIALYAAIIIYDLVASLFAVF